MAKRSITDYSVHPSVSYARAILENLPDKTGRPLGEWVRLLRETGPAETDSRRACLKVKHGLGGTTARLIVYRAEGCGAEDTDPNAYKAAAHRYVEAMYGGAKEALRPIHDGLLQVALDLGTDVKICPCQTIVPLYRTHVFAQIKPTTKTRVDLGFALKGASPGLPERILETGGLQKGDRITHRIPLTEEGQIDDELVRWLEIAYRGGLG
ncbi:MAG: DUF5655 domain-containing protein [Gemmatimonadota bacterium]